MDTTISRHTHALARPSRVALIGVVAFAAALAAASQVAIPLPGTPVPITLQPFVVVLAGLWLGPLAGAASMLLYLAAGVAGLPVFAPIGAPGIARLFGPTGGYLLAYPVAAWAAGFIAQRVPTFKGRVIGALAGMVVIFIGGISQLSLITGDPARAVQLGVTPFALLDVVKACAAAALAERAARVTRRPV